MINIIQKVKRQYISKILDKNIIKVFSMFYIYQNRRKVILLEKSLT
jgi:hypothetical protein